MDTTTNPYANPKVKQSIGERETQRAIDNLRRATQKIINDYDIPMPKALEFMATLGSLEEAAISTPKGMDYLDKLGHFCLEEALKTHPPSVKKTQIIDDSKPRLVGTGADRRVYTGELKVPTRNRENVQQQTLDDQKPAAPQTTVLGNPITDDAPDVEIPQDIKDKVDAIKASAQTPDLSDVTKLKATTKVDFEADELGGDDKVIPAEFIDEKPASELDQAFGPKVETPLFDFDAAITVANMLSKAFPDKGPEYKLHFFREVTGLNLVKDATTADQQAEMFRKLEAGIEHAKNNPVIPDGQEAVETVASGVPVQDKPSGVTAPENQASNGASTTAIAVIQKSEVSTASKSTVGFRMPSPEQFSYMQQLAKFVSESGYYKDVNTPAKAMVIMMKGYSLNIEPMTALDGIFVINGRPFVGAKLVKGLLEATGQCQRFDIFGDNKQCTVTIQRKGRAEPNVFHFTWEDATKAQLVGKDNWQKYPAQMLRWRAVKQAVDTEFPELSFGLGRDEDEEEAA